MIISSVNIKLGIWLNLGYIIVRIAFVFRSNMESEKNDFEVEKKKEKTGSCSEHQMNSFQIKGRMSVAMKKRLKDNETDLKMNYKKNDQLSITRE